MCTGASRAFRSHRVLSRAPTRALAAAVVLCLLSMPGAALAEDGARWPYPLAETERAIGLWLAHAGFEVVRASNESGVVRLSATRGAATKVVILRSCSALATCVAAVTPSGDPDPAWETTLSRLQARYAAGTVLDHPLDDDEVPPAVAARKGAVVCLEVKKGQSTLSFSGFVLDWGGRILTTAHDLDGVRQFSILRAEGTRTEGRLARWDRDADLALIEVAGQPTAGVPLKGARGLLNPGELLFSIGCPTTGRETVRSGRARTPMRRVRNQRLWQVDMETLSGASGSPVFDASGNLAGVVKGRFRGTENTGFVIPMETVVRFLDRQ